MDSFGGLTRKFEQELSRMVEDIGSEEFTPSRFRGLIGGLGSVLAGIGREAITQILEYRDEARASIEIDGIPTAASIAAAQRVLDRQDAVPVITRPMDKPVRAAGKARAVRPARRPEANLDVEALIRATAERIQAQGSAETDRLRDAMRQAIAVLEVAAGS